MLPSSSTCRTLQIQRREGDRSNAADKRREDVSQLNLGQTVSMLLEDGHLLPVAGVGGEMLVDVRVAKSAGQSTSICVDRARNLRRVSRAGPIVVYSHDTCSLNFKA